MADPHDRIRDFWDEDAEVYDRSPSHAISDPVEAAAWRTVLRRHLPSPGAAVLEAGAGTGSITVLLAELGYRVTALDLSPSMLDRARRKAEEQDLEIEFVVGQADHPPGGPFDAVVERNMLWTTPDPVAVLRAWRGVVAPGAALLLLEGLHGREGVVHRARELSLGAVRKVLGKEPGHHGHYDPDLLASLPLARATSPAPLLQMVTTGGWSRIRIERLRDVEWARRLASPPALGALEAVPLFAVIAEA